MSDPNEGEATLVKAEIEPEQVGENTIPNPPAEEEDKKLERNESDVRSSLGRSRSDDSLKGDVNLADSIVGDEAVEKTEQEEVKK